MRTALKITGLALAVSLLVPGARGLRESLRRVTIESDIAYGKDPLQRLDLYLPQNVGFVTPVLVLIHGGAWKSGFKGQLGAEAWHFARQGVLVVAPDYRLSPAVRYPEHREDIRAVLQWTERQAERLGFRKERIRVLGLSAGAHLAAAIAGSPEGLSPGVPSGFIGMAGTYDLSAVPPEREHFCVEAFGPRGSSWVSGSPRLNPIALRAPWLLIHALRDEEVDPNQSRAFGDYLKNQGVAAEVIVADGFSHAGIFTGLGTKSNPFTERVLAFLRQ